MQNKALLAIGKWDLVTSVIMLLTNIRLDADKRTEPMKKLIWASLPMFLLMMMIGCAGTLGPHDFGFVEPGVFASKDSNRFYPNIQVKIGRFTGKNEDLRFQEIEEGNLVQLLENVPKQLNSTFLTKKIDFKGLQRIEKGEYPVAAIREML
ncbi:MAG: hypothetical protein U9Q91_05120, partial [Candidatus Marinimicrobia bacterium]|nr:hypothetical protein [Candidatus Neomarinimicrobiota bacterium]